LSILIIIKKIMQHDEVVYFLTLKHTFARLELIESNVYIIDGKGCGLCQTGAPCESKIPTREDVKTSNFIMLKY